VCSVSGNTLSKLASGLCTVVATQDGTDFYTAASMSRDIPIGATAAPALTFLSGYNTWANGTALTTKESGVVETPERNVWWCPDCSMATSGDGNSFTFTTTSGDPPAADWASSRALFWIHAANLKELNPAGDTLAGVRIDAQAALNFNLAQNAEWFGTGANGVNIEMFLGHFNLKNGKDACNVTLKATLTPTAAAATNYSIGLRDGFALAESCGLAGLDLWSELQDYPVSRIKFSAVEPNGKAKGAAGNYQTQYTLSGAITFQ